MTPYIVLIAGLFLLWLEFYLPGGVFAIFAAIFLVAAQVLIWTETESGIITFLFFVATCVLSAVIVMLALKRIRKSGKNNTFYLSKDQEGYVGAHFSENLIGKKGITMTECGPSGYAKIDNQRYPVVCRGPYLEKGQEVEVIGGESGHLIVKPIM